MKKLTLLLTLGVVWGTFANAACPPARENTFSAFGSDLAPINATAVQLAACQANAVTNCKSDFDAIVATITPSCKAYCLAGGCGYYLNATDGSLCASTGAPQPVQTGWACGAKAYSTVVCNCSGGGGN